MPVQVFGTHLDEAVHADDSPVPLVFRTAVDFIEMHGIQQQGLYRLPGQLSRVNGLKSQFDGGKVVVLEREARTASLPDDVNVVTSLLKSFLRVLPEDLVHGMGVDFFDAAKQCQTDGDIGPFKALLESLPSEKYHMLGFLSRHLENVASHCMENKMNVSNLVVVFQPTTNINSVVLGHLIKNAGELFPDVSCMPCSTVTYAQAINAAFTMPKKDPGLRRQGSTKKSQTSAKGLRRNNSTKKERERLKSENDLIEFEPNTIPQSDKDRMLAELRMLDTNINKHAEDMKFSDAQGAYYPAEQMQNFESLMQEKSELKRKLKLLSDVGQKLAASTGANPGPVDEVEKMLMLLANELHFHNREQFAINMRLQQRVDEEKEKLNTAQARLRRLDQETVKDKISKGTTAVETSASKEQLQWKHAQLMVTYAQLQQRNQALAADSQGLCAKLVTERNDCAALRAKLNSKVTPLQSNFQLNRDWEYRIPEHEMPTSTMKPFAFQQFKRTSTVSVVNRASSVLYGLSTPRPLPDGRLL